MEQVLELVESFESISELLNAKEYDIINGMAGGEITLYKCFIQSSSTYIANCVFKGKIFNKISDIKFKYALVGYNYLESWISQSPFVITQNN